jgi:hypothetical protein
LLGAILKAERLPFQVITGTSQASAAGHDMPDFVLDDTSWFVGVYGEVKLPDRPLPDLASSPDNNDQVGRYLAHAGVVRLCNIRSFGLATCDPHYARDAVRAVRALPYGDHPFAASRAASSG